MKLKNANLGLVISVALLSYLPTTASAHGWSEFPKARQSVCFEEGGIWFGTPPNPACALAKEISGSYPFEQRNEFSKNVRDYLNINAVKAAIPDGTLCYANDYPKRGLGAPHTSWSRTEINAGIFEYLFKATAPHNPSYWEFYLTKPNADLSKALAWSDLDLIQEVGNVSVTNGHYKMDVTIPPDRSGDAILFVRWQRNDPAGEGFYNCSDITIINDDITPPEPPPGANLIRGDRFIPDGFETPQIGDTVKYEIFNVYGELARSFDIELTDSNTQDWDRLLASEINGWHKEFKGGGIFIGDWHEEMQHYMYFKDDSSRNFFNSKDERESGRLLLIKDKIDKGEPLVGGIFELVKSDMVVNAGDKVMIETDELASLNQTQGTPVTIENNGTASIIIDTVSVMKNETLVFSASSLDSDRVGTFSFEVMAEEEPVPPPVIEPSNQWDSSKVYVGGDIVNYADQQWKAQWWVQGGHNPKTTYQTNSWGVWRPAN